MYCSFHFDSLSSSSLSSSRRPRRAPSFLFPSLNFTPKGATYCTSVELRVRILNRLPEDTSRSTVGRTGDLLSLEIVVPLSIFEYY